MLKTFAIYGNPFFCLCIATQLPVYVFGRCRPKARERQTHDSQVIDLVPWPATPVRCLTVQYTYQYKHKSLFEQLCMNSPTTSSMCTLHTRGNTAQVFKALNCQAPPNQERLSHLTIGSFLTLGKNKTTQIKHFPK